MFYIAVGIVMIAVLVSFFRQPPDNEEDISSQEKHAW